MCNDITSGVNLGGWLVLEKWITPSAFAGTDARDEYSLRRELGANKARQVLDKHYKSFITEKDFVWLKENNINFLRIPVGYWIFGDDPNIPGNIDYLDFAFEQAEKHNIKILIDMHGAFGSQNGQHHSGKSGSINWAKHQSTTLHTIEKLVKRYKSHESFWGIELLNEPDQYIPKYELKQFYQKAYRMIRNIAGEDLHVVISDQFKFFRWVNGLGRKYKNIVIDRHFYQIFGLLDRKTSYKTKIFIVKGWWRSVVWLTQLSTPMIVGEWSAALSKTATDRNEKYFSAQQKVFSKAQANFYWTYKTEAKGQWNFRSRFNNLKQNDTITS